MEPVSILQYSYNDFVTNSEGESRDFLWKIMSPSITNESQLKKKQKQKQKKQES